MSAHPPNVLEAAKQGNPKAIAALINRNLQPKGITAKALLKGATLEILLEAETVPNQAESVEFVHQGLTRLDPAGVSQVKLYGRQADSSTPAWRHDFLLKLEEAPLSSKSSEPTPTAIEDVLLDQPETLRDRPAASSKARSVKPAQEITKKQPSLPSPMSVGDIVSVSANLYKRNFKEYIRIAAAATAWSLLPIGASLPLLNAFLNYSSNRGVTNMTPLLSSLFVLIALGTAIYASARFQANAALLSRLSYQELVGQPEPVARARRHTHPRLWAFWRVGFLTFCGYVLIYLVGTFCASVIWISGFLLGGVLQNPVIFAVIILLTLVLLAIYIILLLRRFIRLLLTELPLAIDSSLSAFQSVKQSWILSKGGESRILLTLLLALLVSLPLYSLSFIFSSLLMSDETADASSFGLPSLVIWLISTAISTVLLPWWQVLKAVTYADLQNRREGLGLRLRGR